MDSESLGRYACDRKSEAWKAESLEQQTRWHRSRKQECQRKARSVKLPGCQSPFAAKQDKIRRGFLQGCWPQMWPSPVCGQAHGGNPSNSVTQQGESPGISKISYSKAMNFGSLGG